MTPPTTTSFMSADLLDCGGHLESPIAIDCDELTERPPRRLPRRRASQMPGRRLETDRAALQARHAANRTFPHRRRRTIREATWSRAQVLALAAACCAPRRPCPIRSRGKPRGVPA